MLLHDKAIISQPGLPAACLKNMLQTTHRSSGGSTTFIPAPLNLSTTGFHQPGKQEINQPQPKASQLLAADPAGADTPQLSPRNQMVVVGRRGEALSVYLAVG
jgi:hypothetical protein